MSCVANGCLEESTPCDNYYALSPCSCLSYFDLYRCTRKDTGRFSSSLSRAWRTSERLTCCRRYPATHIGTYQIVLVDGVVSAGRHIRRNEPHAVHQDIDTTHQPSPSRSDPTNVPYFSPFNRTSRLMPQFRYWCCITAWRVPLLLVPYYN